MTKKVTAVLRLQGKGITYDYDFNRLTNIHYPLNPANDVTYTYGDAGLKGNNQNQVGRIIKVVSGGGVEERAYGLLGELTLETKTPNTQPASPAYITKYAFDTFGRLMTLTFPDGETLTHSYDAGGNVTRIEGAKAGATQVYLDTLLYDQFEQRTYLKFGNGIESRYTYRPDNRRLQTLASQGGSAGSFQNLQYGYDPVGNITALNNAVSIPPANQYGGPVTQAFDYDNLYRLTGAEGTFTTARDARRYTLALRYDNIHNLTQKTQRDETVKNGTPKVEAKTTYDWAYAYTPNAHPHAPTHIGERTFYYDANGNQTGWTHDTSGGRRTITWDEENRISEVADQGNTSTYKYDAEGQRAVKSGSNGEIAYVNQFYVVRNSAIPTKHIYAGTTRIASKRLSGGNATNAPTTWNNTNKGNGGNPNGLSTATATTTTAAASTGTPGQGIINRSAQGNANAQNTVNNPNLTGVFPGQGLTNRSSQGNANAQNTIQNPNLNGTGIGGGTGNGNGNTGGGNNAWKPEIEFLYFYHPDHLGSTSYVTDQNGKLYEHLQYFPFGESWIEEGPTTRKTPYRFTSKEYDQETGLYYFGARYYDPRTSVWQSADPILGKYLPSGNRERDTKLPGIGGIYNPFNLGMYSYSHQKPVKLVDPDGNAVFESAAKLLEVGTAVVNDPTLKKDYGGAGNTWCNKAVGLIEEKGGNTDYRNGVPGQFLLASRVDAKGNPQMLTKLQDKNYATAVSAERAVAYAMQGATVIAAVEGHVAIVAPMDMVDGWGGKVPVLMNVGKTNDIKGANYFFLPKDKPNYYIRNADISTLNQRAEASGNSSAPPGSTTGGSSGGTSHDFGALIAPYLAP